MNIDKINQRIPTVQALSPEVLITTERKHAEAQIKLMIISLQLYPLLSREDLKHLTLSIHERDPREHTDARENYNGYIRYMTLDKSSVYCYFPVRQKDRLNTFLDMHIVLRNAIYCLGLAIKPDRKSAQQWAESCLKYFLDKCSDRVPYTAKHLISIGLLPPTLLETPFDDIDKSIWQKWWPLTKTHQELSSCSVAVSDIFAKPPKVVVDPVSQEERNKRLEAIERRLKLQREQSS